METIVRVIGVPQLANFSITAVLSFIILTLCFKYVVDLFRKNPRQKKFAKTLRGPPTLPLLGNSLDFTDGSMQILQEYEKKYGSMYRLWFGKHLVIATTDLDFIETIFHSSKVLDKPSFFLDTLVPFTSIGLFTSDTLLWKRIRRMLQTFFMKNTLSTKVSHMNQIVKKHAKMLEKHADGAPFNVGSNLELLSFDMIVELLLGTTHKNQEEKSKVIGKCFHQANLVWEEQTFKPWLSNVVLDAIFYRKIRRNYMKHTTKFFEEMIEKIMPTEEPESDHNINFIELLHQIQNSLGLEKHYIRTESINMMVAGYLTTSTTASFTLLMLAMHPDVQEKLHTEIIEKLGSESREPDVDDLKDLHYLDQVLKETERRFLLLPVLFRCISEDMTYGSHKIPAGTSLLIAAKAIHMHPQYYKNPEAFDPDHFSEEAVRQRPKLAFFPFSAGSRGCIGKALAEIELKLIVIYYVQLFKFSTPVKMQDFKLNLGLAVTLDKYMVSIQRR